MVLDWGGALEWRMLHEGRVCLDVAGEAKARLTVEDLLAEFRRRRGGEELDDDALLLG